MTDVADARSQVPALSRSGTEAPHQARPVVIWAALVVVWKVLVQPWRRERTLTFDGMFLIAWASAWAMQDSWFNYTRQWFNYNAALFDLGCPQCEVPGWQSPHGDRVAEPLFVLSLYMLSLYIALCMGCVLCNKVMRAAKARWPRLGTVGLIGVALGTGFPWA